MVIHFSAIKSLPCLPIRFTVYEGYLFATTCASRSEVVQQLRHIDVFWNRRRQFSVPTRVIWRFVYFISCIFRSLLKCKVAVSYNYVDIENILIQLNCVHHFMHASVIMLYNKVNLNKHQRMLFCHTTTYYTENFGDNII